ncbi:MAG: glutathione S-transferase family protein [Alphaproteobacteria bacterium]
MTDIPLILHVAPRSGNCHKVELFLSILGLPYRTAMHDYVPADLESQAFLAKNPRGQVPVLEIGDTVIWDSQAILVYLARAYGGERWLPNDAAAMAEVMQWLALSANEHQFGLAQLRIMRRYRRGNEPLVPAKFERAQALAARGLETMESRLARAPWLALDRPTIAEMACFTYPALHREVEIDLAPYPATRAWLDRVRALPGFKTMEGID